MLGLEASAMLAGIVLDTKGFTLKTGSRTFEAAAYLRREGADSITVKKLFQNDLENYTRRAELVKNVEFVEGKYAIVCSEEPIDRALASQTADDLMNIAGVSGSFVIFPFEDTIAVSARSMGRINVQLIMETLGGGGHFTAAGAQLRDTTIEEVKSRLLDAITLYSYRAGV
jgi:c-di-AMP phosphodiesterase-like protein